MNWLVMTTAACAALVLLSAVADADEPPDPARVSAIAAMLPDAPVGLGRPISDRAAWDALAATPLLQSIVAAAERLLAEPLPEQPDDLYLDFSRTGNRTRWQEVAGGRRGRVRTLTLAECAENRGRFLPALEEVIAALCAERTWVLPAHDRSLTNFRGESVDIDLASSSLAWELATANWLLGERLSPQVRELIRTNLARRVLDPYRDMFLGKRAPNWWLHTNSNWNAVCLAGVTGAALAQLPAVEDRAQFVVAAERYSRNFLTGFTPDGYCSEGLGYWNYGFGHYVLLSETIRQATGGGVDLLARPEALAPARFGANIQIINGVAPAFADCAVGARPAGWIMYFVNRVLGLGLAGWEEPDLAHADGYLFLSALLLFPNAASEATLPPATAGPDLRTWFSDAGVLICRPAPGSDCRMGVALKGGHNAELHNHNDVGSYVVVIGAREVLLDPGAEVYTARTFSPQRYESRLLNSFGHPVPVVAGQLQRTGRDACAQVLSVEFGDEADSLSLDLRAAYDVPQLKTLERRFVYTRAGAGSLTVSDHVLFDSPQAFGSALITRGRWRAEEDGSLTVLDFGEAARVEISATGGEVKLTDEVIREEARVQPTRIGINFAAPVTEATLSLTITPLDPTKIGGDWGLLVNGGFELGDWGWSLPAGCQGEISEQCAASGQAALKIADHDPKLGSNISSAPMRVAGAGTYLLTGQVLHVSGSGIGMYVKIYDAAGRLLNPTDERGWFSPIGTLQGEVGKWEQFALEFSTPPEAASVVLWIHSYSAADVEAYLDDLRVIPQ